MPSPASRPSSHCTIAVVVALSSERALREERRKRNSAGWDLRAVASSAATVAVSPSAPVIETFHCHFPASPPQLSPCLSRFLPPLLCTPLPVVSARPFHPTIFVREAIRFLTIVLLSTRAISALLRLLRTRVFYRYQNPRIQDPSSRHYSSTGFFASHTWSPVSC